MAKALNCYDFNVVVIHMKNHVVGILNCFQQSCFILSETFKAFLLLNDTPILGLIFS